MLSKQMCDAIEFVERMARFTTPEDEFAEKHAIDVAYANQMGTEITGYADVDEMIADMDDERLCDEYTTFMDMVRAARKIFPAEPEREPTKSDIIRAFAEKNGVDVVDLRMVAVNPADMDGVPVAAVGNVFSRVAAAANDSLARIAAARQSCPLCIEHPDYPLADWQYDVANGDTKRGYDEWVAANREEAG